MQYTPIVQHLEYITWSQFVQLHSRSWLLSGGCGHAIYSNCPIRGVYCMVIFSNFIQETDWFISFGCGLRLRLGYTPHVLHSCQHTACQYT